MNKPGANGAENTGALAEQAALRYLQKKRLALLAQNYRCRFGEIDLIMKDGAYHVFVEVRRRKRRDDAIGSVDDNKQRRLAMAATHYLGQYLSAGGAEPMCRFDVIAIDDGGRIEWLQNAFDGGD